jgi:hypothetical protein
VSIAVVTLAGAIQWLVVRALIRLSAAAVAVAEHCRRWPRTGLTLLDIGEWCCSVARLMLPTRR